jgi:hypothetical protein
MLSPAQAQQQQPAIKGVIRGLVTTSSGEPAKHLRLFLVALGGGGTGGGNQTKTDATGEYRFEKLTFWGTYRVYPDDEAAGYSALSAGPISGNPIWEVEVTPEHPEAELNIALPPKAGFIKIHLANRRTGAPISEMKVWIAAFEPPNPGLFSAVGRLEGMILVPPDRNLLLHVTANGFREWDESVGRGKPINVPSETTLTLNVQLDPID